MAERAASLRVEIALDGAKEIEKQLEGLGKAGEKAFVDIKAAADKVGGFEKLDPQVVTNKLRQLGIEGPEAFRKIQAAVQQASRLESFIQGIDAIQRGFAGIGNAVLGVARVLGPLGLAIGAASAAMVKMGLSSADAAVAMDETAQKLGLTIEQYERLRAAANAAGLATSTLNSGLQKLKGQVDAQAVAQFKAYADEVVRLRKAGQLSAQALNILNAEAAGTGEKAKIAQEALKQMGTSASSAGKQITTAVTPVKTLGEMLEQTVRKLQAMPDSAKRTAEAIETLGEKLGTHVIQLLREGPEAVEEFLKQIREGTGGLTDEQIKDAARLERAYTRLQERIAALRREPPPKFVTEATISLLNAAYDTVVRLSNFMKDPSWANFAAIFEPGWELIKQGAAATWEAIKSGSQQFFAKLPADAQQAAAGLVTFFQNAATSLATFFDNLGPTIRAAITAWVTTRVEGAWEWVKTTFDAAIVWVMQKIEAAKVAIATWVAQAPGDAWGWLTTTFDAAVAWVTQKIEEAKVAIAAWVTTPIEGAWGWMVETFQSIMDQILAAAEATGNKIKEIFTQSPAVGGPSLSDTGDVSGGPPGLARGGRIGGRGTGTSDSNLAWLSRGEHIMPARAVQQPGVLAFLEALRRSGGNLRRVLDGMSHFALGGMVRGPIPAFAGGGSARATRPLTLVLDGQRFPNLNGPVDVVDSLEKQAVRLRAKSIGRAPSWVK